MRESCQCILAASAMGCAVTARVFPGKIGTIAQGGELLFGLVFLQVSPNLFQYWKALNGAFDNLETQKKNLDEFISIRRAELADIEETIAAQEEVSRMRMDALLAADRQELSEREAEVTSREQAVEADELELNNRLEALRAKTLEEARLTLERERLQFEQQCEQDLAELAEIKANLEESNQAAIAEIEELEAQKNAEIAAFHERQQRDFEEECKRRDAEYKAAKKDFLISHNEQVDGLKSKIEQLESELAHAANTIAQLQESFPEGLEPHVIAARTIRDVLISQRISCQYQSSYLHEDGKIFVRLRIDYPLNKIKPYLTVIQQRLKSEPIALCIAKGAVQFAFMPDGETVSARVEELTHENSDVHRDRSEVNAKSVLEEPLEDFLAFLKVMEDPLVPIDPRRSSEISVTERNWVLKLRLIDKHENRRHICGIVYQARSGGGDARKYAIAQERVKQIFEAYGIVYQVRNRKKDEVKA